MLTKNKRNQVIEYLHEMRVDNYGGGSMLDDICKYGISIKGYQEMTDRELVNELNNYGFQEFCDECMQEIEAEEAILEILTDDEPEADFIIGNRHFFIDEKRVYNDIWKTNVEIKITDDGEILAKADTGWWPYWDNEKVKRAFHNYLTEKFLLGSKSE